MQGPVAWCHAHHGPLDIVQSLMVMLLGLMGLGEQFPEHKQLPKEPQHQ